MSTDEFRRRRAAESPSNPVAQPPSNPAAQPEDSPGELFHTIDRRSTNAFRRSDLAVGGGWIYWIERRGSRSPFAGWPKHDGSIVRRKPAARPMADPETVAGPGLIHGIAADADRVYFARELFTARPHAGGTPKQVTGGTWLQIVPGNKHLLIRSGEQIALVAKSSGAIETVWEGEHHRVSDDVDGDFFIATLASPWTRTSAVRAITLHTPGAKPAVIAERTMGSHDMAVDGDWIYFGGEAEAARSAPALWRIAWSGGTPERVGDPTWGFREFIIRQGTLYGMVFTGAWKLQKLALTPGAQPVVIDARVPPTIQALAIDKTHLYYLTDYEVKRVPLQSAAAGGPRARGKLR